MSEEQNQFDQLQQKLDTLLKKQELFRNEIKQLEKDIENLKKIQETTQVIKEISVTEPVSIKPSEDKTRIEEKPAIQLPVETPEEEAPQKPNTELQKEESKSDIERFIGENLINKIGIAVTIIGVAIGAKYAIDHKLISPVTRIILGYLVGFGLLFFALRLRKKYENFSSVLLSGSMAIMYFITYAAYSYFDLYPQFLTFILMVVFTIFTVTAALGYNREVIAIIGLVGAYAVPFLLSEGSGKVLILFSYIVIINIGILFISVKKYWKTLYISAFLLSWLILFSWYVGSYQADRHFILALVFLFLFFITFYLTFLSYKIIQKEKFDLFDIVLLLTNSFIFYGIGYSILEHNETGKNLLGLYTLGNAAVHLIVSAVIYRNKLADRNLFYLVTGLVIVFITIAVPVQLSGNWVTLLWIGEATILFYTGRTRKAQIYEYISYPLILLSFISLAQEWVRININSTKSDVLSEFTPFANIQFLSSLIFIMAFAIILILYFNKKYENPFAENKTWIDFFNYAVPVLFVLVVYIAFRNEISAYLNHLYAASKKNVLMENQTTLFKMNSDLRYYKMVCLNCYSLFFFATLALINTRYMKNRLIGTGVFWINVFLNMVFLFAVLYVLSEMRVNYLTNYLGEYFPRSPFNLWIRYISFAFIVFSLLATNYWIRREPVEDSYKILFSLLVHITILWVISSEMLNLMDIMKNTHSYKFGLSIVFGIYALLLFVIGIAGKRKHLRIAGMVLFGATLVKLFFYDITRLDTILKTILFLSIGILMLIVSFLYIKYKKHLFGDEEN